MTQDLKTLRQTLRDLAGKATPGPWKAEPSVDDNGNELPHVWWVNYGAMFAGVVDLDTKDNASLVAAANPENILRLLDALEEAAEAISVARLDLAALVPIPQVTSAEDWPCENEADRECLQNAFTTLTNALSKLRGGR